MHSSRMHTLHCSARLGGGGLCVCLGGLPRGCGWCLPWGCTPPPCGQNSRYMLVTGCNEVVAKVMFLLMSVILSTGGCASVHAGIPPPGADTPRADGPWEQTPPWSRPPRADPPRSRHPLEQTPPLPEETSPLGADTPGADISPGSRPPGADTPPISPREADSGIRSMSGQYASYWNAFLLKR